MTGRNNFVAKSQIFKRILRLIRYVSIFFFTLSIFSILFGYLSSLGYSVDVSLTQLLFSLLVVNLFVATFFIGLYGFLELHQTFSSSDDEEKTCKLFFLFYLSQILYVIIIAIGLLSVFLSIISEFLVEKQLFSLILFPGIPFVSNFIGVLISFINFIFKQDKNSFFVILLLALSWTLAYWIILSILYVR
jgi:hypothetical protein